jgi:SHS2 domain-containing protein
MPYRFLEHTADLAVEIEAPTREGVFQEALVAFTACLTEPEGVAEELSRRFRLAGQEADLLLVDWLGELLYAYEVKGLLFRRGSVNFKEKGQTLSLEAEAWGESYDPDRHPIKVLIKGVTYHGLRLCREGTGWRARVIFDI